MEISKVDWKLFRERVSGWQEHYMEQLAKEYVELVPVIGNLLDANMGSVFLWKETLHAIVYGMEKRLGCYSWRLFKGYV